MQRSLLNIILASGQLAIWSRSLTPYPEDVSSNLLCGPDPGTLLIQETSVRCSLLYPSVSFLTFHSLPFCFSSFIAFIVSFLNFILPSHLILYMYNAILHNAIVIESTEAEFMNIQFLIDYSILSRTKLSTKIFHFIYLL